MRDPMHPECPFCGKAISTAMYVELRATQVIGVGVSVLGTTMYHIECFHKMSEGETNEEGKGQVVADPVQGTAQGGGPGEEAAAGVEPEKASEAGKAGTAI